MPENCANLPSNAGMSSAEIAAKVANPDKRPAERVEKGAARSACPMPINSGGPQRAIKPSALAALNRHSLAKASDPIVSDNSTDCVTKR